MVCFLHKDLMSTQMFPLGIYILITILILTDLDTVAVMICLLLFLLPLSLYTLAT
ncbi:hypothetical protein BDB01DRAFT_807165 [Pilobolus umbonatus]|nr:hypothetical protein BDB01DRAFT_807165 [Pilobolus umbonatus]